MTAKDVLPYAIPLLVFAVLLLRSRKRAARHLRHDRLWIVPLLFGLAIVSGLYLTPHAAFGGRAYGLLAVAAVLGAALGWARAHSVNLHLHPDDGRVMMTTGNVAIVVLMVLFVARRFLQAWALDSHLDFGLVTDLGMVFALGLIFANRVELWRRSQRLRATA